MTQILDVTDNDADNKDLSRHSKKKNRRIKVILNLVLDITSLLIIHILRSYNR